MSTHVEFDESLVVEPGVSRGSAIEIRKQRRKERNAPADNPRVKRHKLDNDIARRKAVYTRGEALKPSDVKIMDGSKRFKARLMDIEKKSEFAVESAARAEILRTGDVGTIVVDPEPASVSSETVDLTRTWKLKQTDLLSQVDERTAQRLLDLKLTDYGPYHFRYTRNGRYLLLGGRRGHVAAFDTQSMQLRLEHQYKETIRDVCWLHDETMFAAAQKEYVHIYDANGVELHCLRHQLEVEALDYLPYHFLLVSIVRPARCMFLITTNNSHFSSIGKARCHPMAGYKYRKSCG